MFNPLCQVRKRSCCLSWHTRPQSRSLIPTPSAQQPEVLQMLKCLGNGSPQRIIHAPPQPPGSPLYTQVCCAACDPAVVPVVPAVRECLPSFLPANPNILWRSYFHSHLHLKFFNSLTWAMWPSFHVQTRSRCNSSYHASQGTQL